MSSKKYLKLALLSLFIGLLVDKICFKQDDNRLYVLQIFLEFFVGVGCLVESDSALLFAQAKVAIGREESSAVS